MAKVVPVKRDADATRQRILDAGAVEIHRHGFRNASVESILADTGLTKGAFYHHFAAKADLGYAVIDESIRTQVLTKWVEPIEAALDHSGGNRKQAAELLQIGVRTLYDKIKRYEFE